MEDCFTTNADLMKASRATRELVADNPDFQRIMEVQEIDEALDACLGLRLLSTRPVGWRPCEHTDPRG